MIPRAAIVGPALAIALGGLALSALAEPPLELAREDPAKIRTAEACGECHVTAYEVWKRTSHATGFKELHRKKTAEAIAGRMGFRLIKRDSGCLRCHYTPTVQGEQLRAASGVSCESCHGAGADWIDVHNDYGGKGITHATETPEHRAERIAESVAAGMRRPSDLYDVAASCFGCHTVPDERLVNVGKHSIGSAGFELVAWSEKIRHNFLESFKTGDGTVNAERPPERERLMYVAGRALDLEHALRGAAAASEKGVFFKAMQRRVRGALNEVRAIAHVAGVPEMEEMVDVVRDVDVRLGNRPALLAAAERVGRTARRFLDRRDGTRLASLDPLVAGTAEINLADEGDEAAAEAVVAGVETPSGAPGATPESAAAPGSGSGAASAPASAARAAGTGAVPAVGEKKARLRPRSRHATLDAVTCSKCHGEQNAWWFGDPHYAAIEPFLERERENVKIARFYGISPSRMARGDSLCMDCHGTVVTGRETREVADGVSCQSCHGGAKDFLEPHQEGEKAQGLQRPGYVKALQLGMVELKDPDTRAAACSGCHFITDPRLISSGHPTGADFDYASGMRQTRHWTSPETPASTLAAAYSRALSARGPIPEVRLARLAAAGPPAAAGGSAAGAAGTPSSGGLSAAAPAGDGGGAVFRTRTPRARPAASRAAAAALDSAALGLPPFPEIDDETPVEEVLLLLKERLELLYRAVRKEP